MEQNINEIFDKDLMLHVSNRLMINPKTRKAMYMDKEPDEVFNMVYDINDWSSEESVSGHGSTLKCTVNTRDRLPKVCRKFGIKRVLDVACGDFNWMKEIVDSFEYYKGTDIVKRIIDSNIKKYQIKDKIEFEVNDITKELNTDGNFDAIIAKDVLVHFPNEYVFKVLESFKKSGIKYIFLTHFNQQSKNEDIESFGLWRPINFKKSPYNFERPITMIKEVSEPYTFKGIEYEDKTLSLWKIN